MKQRRLGDLYKKGTQVAIDDGGGEVVVWVQKLDPIDHDTCLRKANAARAKVLMLRKTRDSEEWQVAFNEVTRYTDPEALIEYLIADDVGKLVQSTEAELAADEEWEKDDYLQGLRDAWEDGLKIRYAEDPDDPEASRVFKELRRFADEVNSRVEKETEGLRRDLRGTPLEELHERAIDRFIQSRGDSAWLRAYRRWEIFLATREVSDHRKYYFEGDPHELDALSPEVTDALEQAYHSLVVDVIEGKDSPETTDSSPSSGPSGRGETGGPSGHLSAVL